MDEEDSQIGVKIGKYFPTLKDYNGERTFFPKLFTNYIWKQFHDGDIPPFLNIIGLNK